ncbi:metallophosphoesterase family protein [Chthonobacter rhizosphaerae]|uniref:metallophosphoesterase family protein n=1 Tax=Chthonobacter rhizosphaerae TaxID=2735553 RepID=UPI0015EED89B|nr:metallophosphoesterase family protein [Chthonobacter rhizosphaerae]
MTVWFTSDTHFADPRVLRIDRRPYPDLATHDAALIEAWNERVAPGDTVWHLGDVVLGRPPGRIDRLLAVLHGDKHLIIGNNDGPETVEAAGWASARHYHEMELDGVRLVLCHYPFRTWNKMGKGWVDLHGHSHGKLKAVPRQIDVGVDAWGYRPVTLGEMLAARAGRARRPAEQTPPPS